MKEHYNTILAWLTEHPEIHSLFSLCLLVLGAWLANWIVKRILLRGLFHALAASPLAAC